MVYMIIALLLNRFFPTWILSLAGTTILTLAIGFIFIKLQIIMKSRELIAGEGKAVVITGCDTGFGHSLALRLDKLGFKVYATCLNIHGPGAQELVKESSDHLQLIQMDVTKQEQVNAAYELVSRTLEGCELWAVVNNAGIGYGTEFEWCSLEVLQRVLEVNSVGPARVTKAFLPLLRRARGRIVIVASVAGRIVMPGSIPYSMSKFALVALGDGLRREMKKWGVTVHTIEPSFYKTSIMDERVLENHRHSWEELSDEVRSDYGFEFFQAGQRDIRALMEKACKPSEKIYEVIDDLVDAVAGTKPLLRYVPNVYTKLNVDFLLNMPTSWQDDLFRPRATPAALRSL